MWIIPKNLDVSVCVRDTLDSNWDSGGLSLLLERSVMWRSKPSLARTWSVRLKRVIWMQLLSGRILRPSTASHFVKGYTSLLQAIPARENPVPAKGKDRQTLDGFGRILRESLRQLNLFGSSEKTSADTLPLDSPQFIEAYNLWVTKLRRDCLQRQRSARHTREKECMSWPGPSVMDAAGFCGKPDKGRTGSNSGRTLTGKALEMEGKGPHANWPTPRSSANENRTTKPAPTHGKTHGKILAGEVNRDGLLAQDSPSTNGKNRELWMTPEAQNQSGYQVVNAKRVPRLGKQAKGKLNPDWVEQLMGLEVGWTDCDCSVTG